MKQLFTNKIFLVFLGVMGIFGIIQLGMVFLPVVVDGIMCITREPIEYVGTAQWMCDDFGDYAMTEIMIRFFN